MKLKMGSAGLGLVMGVLVFVIFAFIYGELGPGNSYYWSNLR